MTAKDYAQSASHVCSLLYDELRARDFNIAFASSLLEQFVRSGGIQDALEHGPELHLWWHKEFDKLVPKE